MAFIDVGRNYTRTGNGGLTSWGNRFSLIPWFNTWRPWRRLPVIGALLGYIDTAFEALGWLVRGKPISALTVAVTGSVANTVNGLTELPGFWWINAGSALITGRTVGTHARALSEGVIGATTGVLGIRPTVLRSYPAGIGSINGGPEQSGPGYWAMRAAQERGQDPNARYAAYRSGDGREHVAALEAAAARGNYRGM